MLWNLVQDASHCGSPWVLSPICRLTMVARWTAPGPAASPAIAGLSASASPFPRWAHVFLYVNGISFCRSFVLRLEIVRDRCGLHSSLSLFSPILHPAVLNYCSSLSIATSGPTSDADNEFLYFYITQSQSASLVDLWPIQSDVPGTVLGCWITVVSQVSIDLLLYEV